MGLLGQKSSFISTRFNQVHLNQSLLGGCIPMVFGQNRVSSKLLWYGDFTSAKAKQPGGSGLGKGGTEFVYTASIIAALCYGNCQNLLSVWDSTGKFVVKGTGESYTVASPFSYAVTNASLFTQDAGTGAAAAYSVTVNDFNSPGSITYSGTQQVPLILSPIGTVTDPFSGASLGANWTVNEGTFTEGSGILKIATVGGDSRANAWWNANTFSADQSAQCVIASGIGTGGAFGPAVRMASSGETYYCFYHTNSSYFLFKVVAGTVTTLNTASRTPSVGDTLFLNVTGSVLTAQINGVTVATVTDSSIATGQPGVAGDDTFSTSNAIDNFSATGTAPAAGHYSVNPAIGTYYFSSVDIGKAITVSYTFYRYTNITDQLTIIPFVGPYVVTVDNQPYFSVDEGVTYYPSGVKLTAVGGSPSVGQYNPNGGKYTFAAADAGQGIVISYSYDNPNVDNNAPSTLNMTFFSGAQGQAPWSYMTSKHPGQALGYTEISYIASSGLYLGYSPEVPSYSYEIIGLTPFGAGITDACPSDCIQTVLSDSLIGIGFSSAFLDTSLQGIARNFWVANNFFISPVLDSQKTVSSAIGDWCEAGQVANFWSEGLMKFIPYGTTTAVANGAQYNPPTQPVYSFTDSDYLTDGSKAQAPIKVDRSPWQDAYNKVEVQWSVRTNDYNRDVCPEQDDAAIQAFGVRLEPPKDFDFICTLAAAQFAANMRVQRNVHIRNKYTFRVRSSMAWLDVMDVVEVSDSILGLVNAAVRIIKMTEDPDKGITLSCEDFPWATGNPSLYTKQATLPSSILSQGQQAPGDTNLLVIEVPSRANLYQGNILYLFANGNTPNWGGCTVYKALGVHTSTVTHIVATAGTLTITGTNTGSNAVVPGDIVTFFNTGTVLDQASVTVATASGTGFTAAYTGTISSTAISPAGTAWSMTAFQIFDSIDTPARVGTLTSNLASYSSANPDTGDTLALTMNEPAATLSSVSAAAAAQTYPITLSAIISSGPAVEFLSYETATLSSAGIPPGGPSYNVTTLYRGLLGTSGAAHLAGDIFVRLDEASFTYQYDPSLVGSTIFLCATSINSFGNQEQDLGTVTIYPILLAGSGPGAIALDTGGLNTLAPGWTAYRPLSNPITGHDAGSSDTINIASFSMQIGGYGAVTFSSGSITGLSRNTLYYVYFDQGPPTGSYLPAGGSVTYVATTTKETAMTGTYRYFVGSIWTPRAGAPDTTGNNDGGNGAQGGMLNNYYFAANSLPVSVAGGSEQTGVGTGGSFTNLAFANDGDPTTACAITTTGTNGNAQLLVSLPAGINRRYTAATLFIVYSVPTNTAAGAAFFSQINYGYQGVFTQVAANLPGPGGGTVAYTVFSFVLPANINLGSVYVEAITQMGPGSSGTYVINFYEAWLEVTE